MLVTHNFPLPESRPQALRRLLSLRAQLRKEGKTQQFEDGIQEDLAKGYIRKVSPEEEEELLANPRHWILPPFPVFHPDKPDKMRRVLDAAAKNGGMCLNTILDPGPNLLAPLFGVLLRFRAGAVAINADIKEFFPQVAVPPFYQPLASILLVSRRASGLVCQHKTYLRSH